MPQPSGAEMPFLTLATAPANPRAGVPGGTLHRLHRLSARHPEWWIGSTALAAWAFLIAVPHPDTAQATSLRQFTALAAMIVAMMLPLTIGQVCALAPARPTRRHRAAAAFVGGYLVVWVLAMIGIDAAWRVAHAAAGWTAAAGVVIAAAVLWEVAPAQWRRSHGCGEGAAAEEPGDASPVWLGMTAGIDCVASCWALMAACVAFAHGLPVMLAFFLIQLYGRYRRPVSPTISALLVLGICLASLALTGADNHHHHPGM
jgi:predicted metal-binding membrane protein